MSRKIQKIVIVQDRHSKIHTALQFSLMRGFQKLGYDCDTVAFDVNLQAFRLVSAVPGLQRLFLWSSQADILKKINASKSDLVFAVKGYFLQGSTVQKLKSIGKTVICFNPDDPYNNDFGSSNEVVRSAIKQYDAYFIWSRKLVEKIKSTSNPNVFYLPFSVDDDIIKPSPENPTERLKQDIDVSFIGGADKKRIELIKSVASLLDPGIRFSVFGDNWPEIDGVVSHPAVNGQDYLDIMYRSKVNLNILRNQNVGSNNMRTFEIPATRGFMMHEYSEEAMSFFKMAREADYYRTPEECAEKIDLHLKNESQRIAIAEAAYKKIYDSGYLYENLMEGLLSKLVVRGV